MVGRTHLKSTFRVLPLANAAAADWTICIKCMDYSKINITLHGDYIAGFLFANV